VREHELGRVPRRLGLVVTLVRALGGLGGARKSEVSRSWEKVPSERRERHGSAMRGHSQARVRVPRMTADPFCVCGHV
jgi:hypothetical protein